MSIWTDAGAAIDAAFADPEPLIYTGAGLVAQPIAAIRSDVSALPFDGPGKTLRQITYEIDQADLPAQPDKTHRFDHRGRRWKVKEATRRDEIGKWEIIAEDLGAIQ